MSLDVKNLCAKRPLLFPIAVLSQSQEGGRAVPCFVGLTLRESFGP